MDKMIVSMGTALIALGAGFWIAFQMIPGLHSAYITGGVMWMALGTITIGVGLKKAERLGSTTVENTSKQCIKSPVPSL